MQVAIIRADGVFDGIMEIPDSDGIPSGFTRDIPNVPEGFYAIMQGGWGYVEGEKPQYPSKYQIAAENKSKAEALLQQTDWTENNSVRDVTKTPHLINGNAFDDYRVSLRTIAIDPPNTEAVWPVKPNEEWSS